MSNDTIDTFEKMVKGVNLDAMEENIDQLERVFKTTQTTISKIDEMGTSSLQGQLTSLMAIQQILLTSYLVECIPSTINDEVIEATDKMLNDEFFMQEAPQDTEKVLRLMRRKIVLLQDNSHVLSKLSDFVRKALLLSKEITPNETAEK